MRQVFLRVHDLFAGCRQRRVCLVQAAPRAVFQHRLGEARAVNVGELQVLAQHARRRRQHRIARIARLGIIVEQALGERADFCNVNSTKPLLLQIVEDHHQRRFAFDEGVRRQLGIGIALRPLLEAPQVEMLILQCVHQFVRHDLLLLGERQPRGQIKLPGLRLVKTGYLLAQQLDDGVAQVKVLRHQAELNEGLL